MPFTDIARVQRHLPYIKLLILDVDGVLTDGRLWYGPEGEALKVFHVQDGLGIKRLHQAGVTVAIISGRQSHMVAKRAAELGITQCHQGIANKLPVYQQVQQTAGVTDAQTAVMGDDLPDIPMIKQAGIGIAVANAQEPVKQAAAWVTHTHGGSGAVREVADLMLQTHMERLDDTH